MHTVQDVYLADLLLEIEIPIEAFQHQLSSSSVNSKPATASAASIASSISPACCACSQRTIGRPCRRVRARRGSHELSAIYWHRLVAW